MQDTGSREQVAGRRRIGYRGQYLYWIVLINCPKVSGYLAEALLLYLLFLHILCDD